MVKYYLIPTSLEILTAQLQTAWLASSSNAFVCMSGVFKQVLNEVQTEFSTVQNQSVNKNDVSFILKKFQALDETNEVLNFELECFLLEGELDEQTAYLAALYNIQAFDNNEEIITYLKENNLV
jgi:hypothetical protein